MKQTLARFSWRGAKNYVVPFSSMLMVHASVGVKVAKNGTCEEIVNLQRQSMYHVFVKTLSTTVSSCHKRSRHFLLPSSQKLPCKNAKKLCTHRLWLQTARTRGLFSLLLRRDLVFCLHKTLENQCDFFFLNWKYKISLKGAET